MSEVVYREGLWTTPASQRTFSYRVWRPTTTRALLVVLHGFGEHSWRYHAVAETLVEEGFYVAAPDLWAHGRSGGVRGDLGDVPRCVAEIRRLTEEVFLPEAGQTHYGVFGHSFGGLAAIHWAVTAPPALRRVSVQSPLLEVGFPIPCWKRMAVSLLAGMWPTYSLSMNLDAEALSHDASIVQAYRSDPLVHNAISAWTYRSILRTRDEAFANARAIRVPVLLLCGTADRIISVAAAQRWFEQLACEKQYVAFPGSYHELHHEAVRDEVVRLVGQWTLAE